MAKATNANKAGTTTTRPAYNRPLGRAAAKQTPEIIAVSEEHRPFRRINFIQMGICAGLILIGFLLMLGGGSSVEGGFNPDIFSTRRIVIGKYGIPAEKVVTVHNAVRFGESEDAVPERAVKDKVVTFLGRITYQKGPDYFVEAAAKVLQRVPDVRFVMATNTDLAKKVEEGTFREDLYYRVNVVQIHLPPLRERREDIPLLVAHFVAKFTADNNMKQQKSFSTQALNYLTGYDWPGNIRQLENVVESCMVLVPGNVIEEENLPAEIRDEESQFKSAVDLLPVQLDLADTLQKIEAALIRRALVRADLVQVKAAELLNISKSLLQYKLKKYGITGH